MWESPVQGAEESVGVRRAAADRGINQGSECVAGLGDVEGDRQPPVEGR